MHWIIYAELKKFTDQKFGTERWDQLLLEANLGSRTFAPGRDHPDAEAVAIVVAASNVTGLPVPRLLEAFGEFLVPDLLKFYGNLVRPGWRTLDVIEHAEEAIHTIVRLNDPLARPPKLGCERVSRGEVVIRYDSSRRLCGVARGIATGLAAHFKERIAIREPACMEKGARACEIRVQTVE